MTPEQEKAFANVKEKGLAVFAELTKMSKSVIELAKEKPTAVMLGALGVLYAPLLLTIGVLVVGALVNIAANKLND